MDPSSQIDRKQRLRIQALALCVHLIFYLIFAWVSGVFGDSHASMFSVILGSLVIWISLNDFEHFEIPDTASALLAATGAMSCLLLNADAIWLQVFSAF